MSGGLTCPVHLGSVKPGGVEAKLHLYTQERHLHKVEKLLKQGVDVDCVNQLSQTSLYCCSLLGFTPVVELLLRYGADPNRRSKDRSTPVHAAAFSCNTGLLGKLLEAGGDLRLHDNKGRTPRHWVEYRAQEDSVKMVSFISSCMSVTRSLSESQSQRERDVTPTSPKTLLDFIKPVSDMVFNKKLTSKMSVCDSVLCYGFGKFCVEKLGKSSGALASVPLISDAELSQAEDEALHSFTCGSFTKMTNYSWRGTRITLKEHVDHAHSDAQRHHYHDLLITELHFCCQLFHPHLLQLMAVSLSNDLLQNKLVYERVHVGSLYHLLYHRGAEFLQAYDVLSMILQVCDALFYLHSRSLVLRSLSSHSVVIVHPGVAKVTGLGFMGPSDCSPFSTPPIHEMLYNWAAPEVIRNKACTEKADLYSICALIQELYTDSVPWGLVKSDWIKEAVDAGQALCADPAVPHPYYNLVLIGLKPKTQERTCSLQDLRFILRSHLRELSQREDKTEERPLPARSSLNTWDSALGQVRERAYAEKQQVMDQDHLDRCDPHRDINTSSSDNVSNTILNLKVCKVLVQELQPCVSTIEAKLKGSVSSGEPGLDEPDGLMERSEKRGVVLKAQGPPFIYYDRTYQFSEELKKNRRDEHTWTSEGRAAVAQVGLSVSDEECEDAHLEQLFKGFAGVDSESDDSTAYHTFTLSAAQEVKGQHQTSDSEDDPDVTLEVCRPYITAQTSFPESLSSPEEHSNPTCDSVLLSAHTTRSSHMTPIADLSSITCSPAQLQQQAEQNAAQPRPHSTHFPTCNSTPRSPPTDTATPTGPVGRTDRAVCEEKDEEVRDTGPQGLASDHPPGGAALFTDREAMQDEDEFSEEEEEQRERVDAEQEVGRSPDPSHTVPAVEYEVVKSRPSCDTTGEETKRAHSTLDEVLQGFLENPEA